MRESSESAEKMHYICQTYIAKRGGGAGMQVDKVFEYTSAADAENRAERESRHDSCLGADAYMIAEDLSSGEVSAPTFLARFGDVPETED